MTNTQILAKDVFSKLRRLILSDDFSTAHLNRCNDELTELYKNHPPHTNDIQSLKEIDMISMFGFQLCKTELNELRRKRNTSSESFQQLMATVQELENSITAIMDFQKLSNTLESRMERLAN